MRLKKIEDQSTSTYINCALKQSSGQFISRKLGLDIRHVCFSHYQQYVTSSRATHPRNTSASIMKIFLLTKAVVCPEVSGDILENEAKKIAIENPSQNNE